MEKSKGGFVMGVCFLLSIVLLALAAMVMGALKSSFAAATEGMPLMSTASAIPTVIIDAGHGGEDAGASSATGLREKDINLAVAEMLRDLLEANGIPTVMTRTQDVLLYDRNANYQGHKKSLDLAARKSVADHTKNAILVSIHMNAYPDPQYSGLQVWYSTTHPMSQEIAQDIQNNAKHLDPQNHRDIKAAGKNIYLLHHATCPAVLVECGFLSNPPEAEKLGEETYQKALAFVIFQALCHKVVK